MGIVPSRKIRMLHTDELEKALKRYPDFQGVYAVDQLPKDPKPGLYIANTDPSDKDGEHWVLFYICKEGTIEFFDSFGRKPLERWPGEWKYSTRMVQSPTSNACGYHVLCYAYFRRFRTFEQIMGWYGDDLKENDKKATFVARYIYGVKLWL